MKKLFISVLIGLFVLPQMTQAQVNYQEHQKWYQDLYSDGFGKNWIHWDKFDWKVYKEAEHIDIYYYITPEEKKLHQNDLEDYEEKILEKCVRWGETAYKTASEKLLYEIPEKHGRPRLFFFITHSDYEQNNMGGPGGSAFAEMIQWRVVLVRGDYPDTLMQKIVIHEMTHIFEFSLWWGGKLWPSPANPKIWRLAEQVLFLLEGLSQYVSDMRTTEYEAFLRYMALTDNIPEVEYWTLPSLASSREINYIIATIFWEFIETEYGKHAFRNIVHEFRKAKPTFRGMKHVFKNVLQKEGFADFNRKFRMYLKNKYKPLIADKKEIDEYGRNLLAQENLLAPNPEQPSWVAEPTASPTGDLIAVISGELDIDIEIINRKDGTRLGNLTKGLSWYKYGWWIIVNPNSPGRSISWSPDGKYILFFSRTGEKNSLFLVQPVAKLKQPDKTGKANSKLVGEIFKKINLNLDQAESPEMSPDNKTIVFQANEAGQRDLFLLNLEDESIINLTNDEQFDYAPSWSPDGKKIIYVVDVNGHKKLFSLDLATGTKTQLTFGPSNETRPIFSKDGTQILFLSDRGGNKIINIYSLDVQTAKISQLTDLLYGAISFYPLKDKTIVVGSVGYKSYLERYNYNLHTLALKNPVNDDIKDLLESEAISEPQKIEEAEIDKTKIEEYNPLKNIHVAYISGQGRIDSYYGEQTAITLALSDLTGDHLLYANYANFSWWRYKYFTTAYINLSRRLQYAVVASAETHYLYPYYLGRFFSYTKTELDDVLTYLELNQKGMTNFAFYPLDAFHRIEFSLGAYDTRYQHPDWRAQADYWAGGIETIPPPDDPVWQWYPEGYRDLYLANLVEQKEMYELRAEFLESNFRGGTYFTLGTALVRDTTKGRFTGGKQRIDLSWSTGGHNRTIRAEAIQYLPLSKTIVFALRGVWSKQRGDTVYPVIVGEFAEIPRYGVIMKFTGNDFWMATAELRFPLIRRLEIAGLGNLIRDARAALFADVFEIKWSDNRFNAFNKDELNPSSVKGVTGIQLSFGNVPFLGPVNFSISKRVISWNPLALEKGWRYRFYLNWGF